MPSRSKQYDELSRSILPPPAIRDNCKCGKWLIVPACITKDKPLICECGRAYWWENGEPRWTPDCPYCGSLMTRAHWQNEDGGWHVVWLCDCEPAPEIVEEAKKVAEGMYNLASIPQDLREFDPLYPADCETK